MAAKGELEKFIKERRRAYDKNTLQDAASACNSIGAIYTKKGEYQKALQYHQEELQLSESIRDVVGVAVAHRKIGECFADLCHFSKALKEQEKYLNIAESLSNTQEIQRAYATIGRIWYMRYKAEMEEVGVARYLDKAHQAFLHGLRVCDDLVSELKEGEVIEMRARLYLNLGLVAEERKDFNLAETRYQKTSQLAKECGNHELVWQSLFNLSELLINAHVPNRALIALEESLKYAELSKNKQQRANTLLQIAMAYIQLVDFPLARKHLKLALKLNVWDDEDYQQVVRKYKVVSKVLSLLSKTISCDVSERIKLHDVLGDICSNKEFQFYNAAVKYYQIELHLAEDHGFEKEQLSRIYFSLAETYTDNGQYTEALDYYMKELNMWKGHPPEEATTWTNIARVYESANNISDAITAYTNAIRLASSTGTYKVLGEVYRSLVSFCKNCSELERETETYQLEFEELLLEHPEMDQPIKLEKSQEATPLSSQDLNTELVLSSSESEDEEDIGMTDHTHLTRQLRGVAVRKRSKLSNRNEKGETPLHVAAIAGHVTRVRQLLSDGADINARDYCGWTPLHEACNHGNLDVVECLLDHCATINDVGGEHCRHTTPLMDAALNRHVGVVSLLITRGADLTIKNANDKTALGLVEEYLSTHSDDESCETIEEDLIQSMRGQGLHTLIKDAYKLRGNRRTDLSSSPPDTPIAIVHPLPHANNTQSALISLPSSPEDNLLSDEWLLDDMGRPPHKRRRKTNTLTRRLSGCGQHRPLKRKSIEKYDSISDSEIDIPFTPPTQSAAPPTQSFFAPTQSSPVLRVKVRIGSDVFLVPCPWQQEDGTNTNIEWLITTTSERYFHQHGRHPILSLTTQDGALLYQSDSLIDVLQERDEVVGVVKHWETPPIHQHYESVCEQFKTSIHCGVLQVLQSQSSLSSTLSFTDIGLQSRHCPALCHTLLAYHSLTSLNLSGNLLTDAVCIHLVELLSSLRSLYHLDLSCIGITEHGVHTLSQALSTITIDLKLKSLQLNHNDLGPYIGSSLAKILIHTPSLSNFGLNDCGLTAYTMETHNGLITALSQLESLQEVTLDDNTLNEGLMSLENLRLISLSLKSTLSTRQTIKFPQSIVHLNLSCCVVGDDNLTSLSSLHCLQLLNLSGSLSSTNDVHILANSLSLLKNLKKIDLSGNRCLGNTGLVIVLEACKSTSVDNIIVMDCQLMSPLPSNCYTCLDQLTINRFDVRDNVIQIPDQNMLKHKISIVHY